VALEGVLRFLEKPEKRERRRREFLEQRGRGAEAYITDVSETTLYYSYTVGGVLYEASQDVALLLDKLPAPPERLAGVAHVKYAQNNPASSILVSENWCGVRASQRVE
jgi:hypothetical protein